MSNWYADVTMLRLKRTQRAMLADKLPDSANLALRPLVFRQFLATALSWILVAVGLALWVLFMGLAAYFAGER